MLASITWLQFKEWMAFDALEPFGPQRDDHRTAHIVATLLNVNRKRGSKRLQPRDVLLLFGDAKKEAKPQMDWRHMKALAKLAAAAYNAEHDKNEEKKRARAARRTK